MSLCVSADARLYKYIQEIGDIETSFSRLPGHEVKCGFGLQGVCCRLCTNGPCRITHKTPRGVCGATADVIVARNFLRAVAAGAACYLHVMENAANVLKNTEPPYPGEALLEELAGRFGIQAQGSKEKASRLAGMVLADIYRPRGEKMELVERLAYPPRFRRWEELGILPGGAKAEVFDAIVKSSTNLSSDPVDMLLHCLRLGIATGLYGLMLTNYLNDILVGEPKIGTVKVGFSVMDPDYINIMVIGHQHALLSALQRELGVPEATERARQAGAKGFRIVGSTCVGQDLELRSARNRGVFAGHVGNNFTTEPLLATGGIDLVVTEFNCAIPGIEDICEKFRVRQICIDDVAKKRKAEYIPYDFGDSRDFAWKIIDAALASYKDRRKEVVPTIPDHGCEGSVAGVGEKSLKQLLGGSYKPLIDLIAEGQIKGIAGIVGCSNLATRGHDVFTVELTRELIRRDIIVLTAGCTSGGLANLGMMLPEAAEQAGEKLKEVCRKLGIPPVLNFGPCLAIGRLEAVATEIAAAMDLDLPQLPLALSAPQWLEEQALADGAFALTLGLLIHLGSPPFITGSDMVTGILTRDLEGMTGGKVLVEEDPVQAAAAMETHIMKKREELKI
ncbi:MAG: anaerobic carbon-monoxide dehydrogenase catalytic subunit [Moorella sp. (in: firmicutes)]|uniref:anaerobic carbon-monoxide dehydrogenase n=1 Tax=Neomoorella thermoacetica TaxID=1525 RepID=A0A1J5NKL5_NEOTH|nr:anaerobic carbon-monoxide dehydrogenase catalytic subunit [Moorella sp. (in: firmicutes)]OIQ59134.1 carbon monoxide dehydrogenase 1 [Moorella thermoacetica]